jgi:hypothetical protein
MQVQLDSDFQTRNLSLRRGLSVAWKLLRYPQILVKRPLLEASLARCKWKIWKNAREIALFPKGFDIGRIPNFFSEMLDTPTLLN